MNIIDTISTYFTHLFATFQTDSIWIKNHPIPALTLIGVLFIVEGVLSIDNAAVLASMVSDLPKNLQKKALRYGIFGAYFFRGLCLLIAGQLAQFWPLKLAGGLYLLFIMFKYFRAKGDSDDEADKEGNLIYRSTVALIGQFWATVILVEVMDIVFSIDNVFAVVGYTKNMVIIWIGVFAGILAMRFVAQGFVILMGKFPVLETSAHIVIGLVGLKLCLSIIEVPLPDHAISKFLSGHVADIIMAVLTILIFALPIAFSVLTKKSIAEPVNN